MNNLMSDMEWLRKQAVKHKLNLNVFYDGVDNGWTVSMYKCNGPDEDETDIYLGFSDEIDTLETAAVLAFEKWRTGLKGGADD